jgi:hypothetical protein
LVLYVYKASQASDPTEEFDEKSEPSGVHIPAVPGDVPVAGEDEARPGSGVVEDRLGRFG